MTTPYRELPTQEAERPTPWLCRWWKHDWLKIGHDYAEHSINADGVDVLLDEFLDRYGSDDIVWARCTRCGRVDWFQTESWYRDFAPKFTWP